MSPTYLHSLSEAALQNVLRHLSANPLKPDWQLSVAPEDALTAVHSSCALCTVARASFTHLQVDKFMFRGGQNSGRTLSPLQLTRWLLSAGQSFDELRLDYLDREGDLYMEGDEQDIAAMIKALSEKCTPLRRLQVCTETWDCVPSLLRATRGRLQELELYGEDVPAIEMYCGGLRKLDLHARPQSIIDILRVAGPTLEYFFSTPLITSEELSQVRKLCPKLSSITLEPENCTDQDKSAYADLLCSYGPQLLSANLKYLQNPGICERVLASCPNVRCDHVEYFSSPTSSLGTLKVLAPNLKSLFLFLCNDTRGRTEAIKTRLAPVMQSCRHLEELYLSLDVPDAPTVLDCVLSHDFPVLASLNLRIYESGSVDDDASDLLQRMSARFQALRNFEFTCPLQTRNALEAFVASAPLLENVNIHFERLSREMLPDFETRAKGIVDAFLKSPELRQLEVSGDYDDSDVVIESVSRLCCRRGRSALQRPYVKVLGVEYLV